MIFGRIAYFIIVFIGLTAFRLSLFYKRNTKWIPLFDAVIQTLGMLLDFRKAKNTRLVTRVFLRFSQVSRHPACLNHSVQTRECIWHFLNSGLLSTHPAKSS